MVLFLSVIYCLILTHDLLIHILRIVSWTLDFGVHILVFPDGRYPDLYVPIWRFQLVFPDLYFSDVYFPICSVRFYFTELHTPINIFRFDVSNLCFTDQYFPIRIARFLFSLLIFVRCVFSRFVCSNLYFRIESSELYFSDSYGPICIFDGYSQFIFCRSVIL